jgi:signal transduction histidine kinase
VFSIEAADELEGLRAETSAHVYRIVQEALTNAAKHASARTVMVKLTEHADNARKKVRLSVIDDGPGQPAGMNTTKSQGSGLIGMQERVSALSGTFAAGPLPKGGFGLHIEFPSSPQGHDQ